MDTAHWPQGIGLVAPMEELLSPTSSSAPTTAAGGGGGGRAPAAGGGERRARPQKEQALNCPRCNSTNTKFCYYNNYSLTQPRYFCKTCRRYWTEGGSLRNVPVGGGSRKNKRPSSATSSAAACPTKTAAPEVQNPNTKYQDGQDLNLAFPFMHPMTMPEYHHPPSSFGVHDFRPSGLSFPLDGLQEGGAGMVLFPFEESRPAAGSGGGAAAPGFWNGLMGSGGGGSW